MADKRSSLNRYTESQRRKGNDMSGKGSAPRPFSVPKETFDQSFDRIFGITCKQCKGKMEPSKAIQSTFSGLPDFPGDDHAVTISPGGPGKLIDCMKCVNCGWSTT